MRFSQARVLLSDIDCEDETFHITTKKTVGDLVRSIDAIGLIHPPLLLAKKNNQFQIVSGFRRIAACAALGLTDIDACFAEHSPLLNAKLAITDNSFQRSLNWVELARAYHLLFHSVSREKDIIELLGVLGLPDNIGMAEKIRPLAQCAEAIQEGVISDLISLPVALELGGLESATGSLLARIFQTLGLGLNVQREILVLVKEIAARESKSIPDILNEKEIQEILEDKTFDRTRKRVLLRERLKLRRFPCIERASARFQEHLKQLKLPTKTRLVAPKYFESNEYS
jgi:hypothetical protein